jgi:hypothetical protein
MSQSSPNSQTIPVSPLYPPSLSSSRSRPSSPSLSSYPRPSSPSAFGASREDEAPLPALPPQARVDSVNDGDVAGFAKKKRRRVSKVVSGEHSVISSSAHDGREGGEIEVDESETARADSTLDLERKSAGTLDPEQLRETSPAGEERLSRRPSIPYSRAQSTRDHTIEVCSYPSSSRQGPHDSHRSLLLQLSPPGSHLSSPLSATNIRNSQAPPPERDT